MSDVAKLFEDRERPGQWHVERIGHYGLSETKMFSGPDALRRALRYAMQKYQRVKPSHSARQGRDVGQLSPTGRS